MAKAPAEAPKSLPNDNRAIYLKHLAIHILDKEEEDRLKARKKGNEKRAADDQIDVPAMKKRLKKVQTMSPGDIAKEISKDLEAFGHHDIDLGSQFNLFGGADPVKKAGPDYFHVGQLAALTGKDCKPPANIKPADSQRWIEGWNDGVAYRILGKEHKAQLDGLMPTDSQKAQTTGDADGPAKTPLETAIAEVGTTLRYDFQQEFDVAQGATFEDITLEDLIDDKSADAIAKAARVVLFDGDQERVLKNRDGETDEPPFESSEAELAAQKARPTTIEKTDAGK